uniref:Ig-like domain-containing protein n=2 Tax=Cacopsylla melanoneura TaxID=428564 RepID=A0A8D9E9V0_9HEMI
MTWLFNGVAIDSEDISVSQNSKRVSALTIESVKHQHAGNYSCAASNIAASSLYTAVLLVNGRRSPFNVLLSTFRMPISSHSLRWFLTFPSSLTSVRIVSRTALTSSWNSNSRF